MPSTGLAGHHAADGMVICGAARLSVPTGVGCDFVRHYWQPFLHRLGLIEMNTTLKGHSWEEWRTYAEESKTSRVTIDAKLLVKCRE